MALADYMTLDDDRYPKQQAPTAPGLAGVMNPEYVPKAQPAPQAPPDMATQRSEVFMRAAQKAAMLGLNEDADNYLALAKAQGAGGGGSENQLTEIPHPQTGKMHKVIVNRGTGAIVKDFGSNVESFKPKNIIGRGWITKRPVMQSNEHGGRAVYADTPNDKIEFASPEDIATLRSTTFKGLEAGQVDQLAGLKNTYERLDNVIERVKTNPKEMAKFGPLSGKWNRLKIKLVNEGETQALQNELKSFITIAYGLSGKQISDSEMQRLQDALLPHLAQPGENFVSTAEFARDWVAKLHNDKKNYFDQAGFESKFDDLKPKGYTFNQKNAESKKVDTKGKVKVISPDGKTGYIPAGELTDALSQGFKRAN